MSTQIFPTLAGSLIDIDRTPAYSTIVQREASGRELRVNTQTAARYRYRVAYDFLRQDSGGDEAQTLLAFFKDHRGSWDSFLFTDPYNSAVTARNFGTGDGSALTFYLADEMGERIAATNGTVLIYKSGVLQSASTDYVLDSATGRVDFDVAPAAAAALTWTGSFYRRVRFVSDELRLQRRFSRVWRGEAELISVLP